MISRHATPSPSAAVLRRYESLQVGLDLIDQGFTLIDDNLCLIAWNKTFLRLFDFPQALIYVGSQFEDLLRFNFDRGEYGAGDPEAYIQGRIEIAKAFVPHTFERVRPNGTVLQVHGIPIPGLGFVTLYSDVTAQRRAEQLIREQNAMLESRVAELSAINAQLREALHDKEVIASSLHRSEAQMRLITDSMPALIAYSDHERNYRYINRGYRDWFGLDPATPQDVSARSFLGVDTYTRIRPNVMRALRGEAVTFEYEVLTLGERLRIVRTTLIPEFAADQSVAGCFELTFDITHERRSHELLVQAQKMAALGQLTGGLAHDFNNILAVILGNLSALGEQPAARSLVSEYIAPAMDAARSGSKLIQSLLTFARKQPLEARVIDVNTLIATIEPLLRRTLPDAIQLNAVISETPAIAPIDPQQLQNTLLNLVFNARDAIDGPGEITVRCSVSRLDEAHASQLNLRVGDYVCIEVQDDGCGMDGATIARVFEPFFTTKTPGRGTGLGLAMAYGFAHQSGGTIHISSEPGLGTLVTLWLPTLAEPTHEPATPEPQALEPNASSAACLALLVDDDPGVRQTIRRMLVALGYSVIEAESGTEAIQILDQTPHVQLLLSDIVMPGGVDGRQVARHARARGDIPKIVLMSGYAPDADQLPKVLLLHKPFTKAELEAALQLGDS
ncbi:PAS-domain containing protein [Rhodoferax sp.]|uniref:PAS-domain containing protein n=1 Tax=Rhodoferax sp. TaxID=50421 RepID=UPI0025E0E8CD|nr:PAS-domain containing protein [Rhodoferax sp.]MCM2297333.1 PAS-domain containing protein [Rhodoferax sp.]